MHHAFFFFAVTARLRRGSVKFHVLWRAKIQDNDFLFLFLNFDALFRIQLQKHLPTFDKLNDME